MDFHKNSEKFVKPSGPPSYILNVRSLNAIVNQIDGKRNLHLKTSRDFHAFQLELLRKGILFKRSRMKTLDE